MHSNALQCIKWLCRWYCSALDTWALVQVVLHGTAQLGCSPVSMTAEEASQTTSQLKTLPCLSFTWIKIDCCCNQITDIMLSDSNMFPGSCLWTARLTHNQIWQEICLIKVQRAAIIQVQFSMLTFVSFLSPLDGSDIGNTIHLICSFVLSLECTTPTLQCQCCTLNAVITPERAWSPLFFYHIVHTKERKCHQINRLKWKVIAIAAKIKYLSELLQALRFL